MVYPAINIVISRRFILNVLHSSFKLNVRSSYFVILDQIYHIRRSQTYARELARKTKSKNVTFRPPGYNLRIIALCIDYRVEHALTTKSY